MFAGAALALVASAAGPGRSETLMDAIRLAYQTNPTLRGQQASLRATDETVVQARAAMGPQVAVTAQGGYEAATVQEPGIFGSAATTTSYHAATGQIDLSVTQPLYDHGALEGAERSATAGVYEGREAVRVAEAQLMVAVITAYCDVLRDRETLKVLRDQQDELKLDSDTLNAQGRLGAISKADVAEAQARLLALRNEYVLTQGQLEQDEALYMDVVGQHPGELAPLPTLPGVPADVDNAYEAADKNNPQILQAMDEEAQARAQEDQAKSAYGPTLGLRFDAAESPTEAYLPSLYDKSLTLALVLSQPIFTSGADASKVRQAADQAAKAATDVEAARRSAVQQVTQSWAQMTSNDSSVEVQEKQVETEQVAVQGYRLEENAGLRQVIDLLLAETELESDQVSVIQTRYTAYVARASLLAAMGTLEAPLLSPGTPAYDPAANLRRVEHIRAVPWEGAIGAIDSIGAPQSPPPRLSPTDSGLERPPSEPIATAPGTP